MSDNPSHDRPSYAQRLRDRLALRALHGLLSNPGFEWDLSPVYTPEENVARRAYAIADAMLAERQKGARS
jgi:hypothetical protein